MALIAIAETLGTEASLEDYDPAFIGKAQEHTSNINRQLAHMGARGRDPQLATVLNWLDQIVGHQRLAERGYRLAQWLLTNVAAPLRQELSNDVGRQTIDWFEYGVRRWALTAANHDGKLFDGEQEVQAMRPLIGSLARQWERAPILFDGLIAQAVHLTDAFEFDRVARDMRLVERSLETQSDLFSNYQAGAFPDPIKFDLRAKAIGTLVQAEMFRGFGDAESLQETRRLSDTSIAEFTDPKDQARQFQYRCHLETIAGDFGAARRYLIWSIRKVQTAETDLSHTTIGRLLAQPTDEPRWLQDFTVSHWLRLGTRICLEDPPERENFITAYDASNLFDTYAKAGARSDFPIHNILRFLAVVEASRQNFTLAFVALEQLHDLDPVGKNEFVMALILCACQAEVAALLWSSDLRKALQLLEGNGEKLAGLNQLFGDIRAARVAEFPRIAGLIDAWESRISALVSGNISSETAKRVLLKMGTDVLY
jgi:hypothetical protein